MKVSERVRDDDVREKMKEQVLIFRRELERPTSVQRKKKLRKRERERFGKRKDRNVFQPRRDKDGKWKKW